MERIKQLYRMHKIYCDNPVSYGTFYNRIKLCGRSEDKAVKTNKTYGNYKEAWKKHKNLHGEKSVSYHAFTQRVAIYGWTIDKAVNTPNTKGRRKEQYKKHKELHGDNAVSLQHFYRRFHNGYSVEKNVKEPSLGHGGDRKSQAFKCRNV